MNAIENNLFFVHVELAWHFRIWKIFMINYIEYFFLYFTVKDPPPVCLDVRQKQRISADDAVCSETKAPAPPEPALPVQPKTMKDFQ